MYLLAIICVHLLYVLAIICVSLAILHEMCAHALSIRHFQGSKYIVHAFSAVMRDTAMHLLQTFSHCNAYPDMTLQLLSNC